MGQGSPARAQQIAFTWDDLPAHSTLPPSQTRLAIMQDIASAMKQAGLPPVYGFINASDLERHPEDAAALQAWRDAGLPLGNHTWSHINLNDHTPEEFEADLEKNEPTLQKYMGNADWRWLRYPFLAEGNTPEKRTAVRDYLAKHNYRIAEVTMSFGDYLWNDPYARCVANHDDASVHQLEESYLKSAEETAAYTRALSKSVYNRDIPYVLLMHVGALDARVLPRLLALYKKLGFTFITLEQAQQDPVFRGSMNPSLPPDALLTSVATAGKQDLPQRPRPPDLSAVCPKK
jgi:peptidoglycan/xylan/chitin deacetylase (PgdA/CDA1 family)